MEVKIFSNHKRVLSAFDSLKSSACEKRNVSGMGSFLVCPVTGLRIYTEGGSILLSEKIGKPPVALVECDAPLNYEIGHPGMADFIAKISA